MKPLIIGADPFPPYQFINNKGNIQGTDYHTVKTIINRMGYDAEFVIKEWSIIDDMFQNDSIDIVFQVQKTPEREKRHYFSNKLRDAATAIITSKGNVEANYVNDLFKSSEKIGVIKEYSYGEPIDTIDLEHKVSFESTDSLIQAVNDNSINYGVVDVGVFNFLNKKNKYKNTTIIEQLTFTRPLYVAFNDENIKDIFNIYLEKI